MKLTNQQEQEIYPILDACSDLPPGKGVLHRCSVRRADYLERMIRGLIYDTAIESIETYQPHEPLYGRGLYGHIWAEAHEQGLLVTKLTIPHSTPMWQIIHCAATHEDTVIDAPFNLARQRLIRAQKKHPEIMNQIWIESGPPVTARFAERRAEELVIVDIDVDPEGPLNAPTPEEYAKARQFDDSTK